MMNTFEIDSLILDFGARRVLNDVYVQCNTGQVVSVLGANGSGKSSLFNIAFGELTATSHSVRIDGSTIPGSSRNPNHLRYLPQFRSFPGNLQLGRLFTLFKVSFTEFWQHFPDFPFDGSKRLRQLSGGQIRLIEIFCVLKAQSKFCILDEPFSQLAPLQIEQVKKIIASERSNKGIILSDHMIEHVLDISDRTYLLLQGKTHPIRTRQDLLDFQYLPSQSKRITSLDS